jgi:hypothetical protein
MECEPNDFIFPMQADVFYPDIEQSAYGNVTKIWKLDRKIACSLNPAGTAFKEEITPKIDMTQDSLILGRTRQDLRFSSLKESFALTNIVVSNITDNAGNEIYVETAGPRKGKSTIFEIATIQPFSGPFNSVEYYKVVLRRSENQGTEV